MHINGKTTAATIVKDIASAITTGDVLTPANNWTLVYPPLLTDITNKAVVKATTKIEKKWVYQELKTITDGSITFTNTLAVGGLTRVMVKDKKYFLYLREEAGTLDTMEYRVNGNNLDFHTALNGKEVLVDYEKVVDVSKEYFVRMNMPATTDDNRTNYYYMNVEFGEGYDSLTDTFPADHKIALPTKLSWFRQTDTAEAIAHDWMSIEYWLTFDYNAAVGVIMGDPGLSNECWMSSPFYWGQVEQIEGALATDDTGNFGIFTGSYTEPTLSKSYGDYTGTGVIDVCMASTKTGRPYNAHKLKLFGGYEFREKTFNSMSSHTRKHDVSDIVVADVHENDRGKLKHCIAVPRLAKTHGSELIYNRFVSGKEEKYVFININALYTPFNTSSDDLFGIAIRKDI